MSASEPVMLDNGVRGNKGVIILFDFKVRGNDVYLLEAGCGFNSNFSAYELKAGKDLRTKTVSELAKSNPAGMLYLDSSLLLWNIRGFNHTFKENLASAEAKESASLIGSESSTQRLHLNPEDIVITCNPSSHSADIKTIQFCETRGQHLNSTFMMGSRKAFAITEDKYMFSTIFQPTANVKRPIEKLINLDTLTNDDIRNIPLNGPCVLKPTDAGEARGILVLKDKEELLSVIQLIKEMRQKLTLNNPKLRKTLFTMYYTWIRDRDSLRGVEISRTGEDGFNLLDISNPFAATIYPPFTKGTLFPEKVEGKANFYFNVDGESFFLEVNLNEPSEVADLKKFIEILSDNSFYKELQKNGYTESEIYGLLYWILNYNDSELYGLVQECIHGNPVTVNEKEYDPTGRVVLFCYEQNGKQTFKVVDAYWKLPRSPTEEKAEQQDKTSSTISYVTTGAGVLLTDEEKQHLVTSLQEGVKSSLFDDVLQDDLALHLLKMIFSGDCNVAGYAFQYIERICGDLGYQELLGLKAFVKEHNYKVPEEDAQHTLTELLKGYSCLSQKDITDFYLHQRRAERVKEDGVANTPLISSSPHKFFPNGDKEKDSPVSGEMSPRGKIGPV